MIAWLVETLVAVTLLMAMVLVLRGPVARSFGAGWAYALWAVPAFRLVLPPLPQLAPDFPLPTALLFIPTAAEMTAPLPVESGPGQWVPFMLALWAGGAVIFLTLQWLAYRAFLGRIRETSRPARPPLFGGIRTWISEAVDGPLALGVVERRIVLPGDFSRRYNPVQRRLALEHELVHHRRGDIWCNLAAMLVLALLWFNPLAWIAFRAFRSDQELACDAAVARAASLDERCDYARALVKSASRPGLIAACALNPADELKRRLRMMRSHRASPARSAGGLAALAAFAAAGFAFGSGGPVPAAAPAALQARAAAAPAVAAPAARLASAQPAPAIVVTAPARARAGSRLRAKPMSIASAAAPAPSPPAPALLATMLRRLPEGAVAPPEPRLFAFAVQAVQAAPGKVQVRERQVFRVVAQNGEAQLLVVGATLSPHEAAELRRAVADAVAEGRKARFRVDRGAEETSGGGGETGFDFDIQTLVKGE